MSTATLADPKIMPRILEAAISPLPVRRFTVDEYHRMIATGILKSGDPYELLHGWIIRKMPIDPIHAYAVSTLNYLLVGMLTEAWVVRCQQPITAEDSEPEPDLCVTPGPRQEYRDRHPKPSEAELVIEVANSSLPTDRGSKLDFYAAAGVRQYWIVNLIDNRVEVYTEPQARNSPTYKSCVHYVNGQDIPLVLGGQVIGTLPVSEFLA